MEKLQVGQVIFILLREDHKIAPVQVVEEVVRRKLAGEEIKYFVRASTSPKTKIMPLEFDKEHVFLTIEEARSYMLDNATKAIESICEEAFNASAMFGDAPQEVIRSTSQTIDQPEQPPTPAGYQRVRLPSGEFVNVSM